MGDNLARQRTLPRSTLGVRPEAEEEIEARVADDIDPLPHQGTSPYVPYALARNQPEGTLHVLRQDGLWRGFAWSNFDSVDTAHGDSPGSGPVLVVRFAGLEPTELRLSGRNLGKLHACIGRNRVVWIRVLPSKRGFELAGASDDKAEVITAIAIRAWEPEPKADGKRDG
jgi:hypothetical protein